MWCNQWRIERELNKQSNSYNLRHSDSNLFIFFFYRLWSDSGDPFDSHPPSMSRSGSSNRWSQFSFYRPIWYDHVTSRLWRSSSRSPGVSCHTSPAHSRMVSSSSARSSLCDQDPSLVRSVTAMRQLGFFWWFSYDTRVLMVGGNGVGKSVLCSSFLSSEHIKLKNNNGEKISVIYVQIKCTLVNDVNLCLILMFK